MGCETITKATGCPRGDGGKGVGAYRGGDGQARDGDQEVQKVAKLLEQNSQVKVKVKARA